MEEQKQAIQPIGPAAPFTADLIIFKSTFPHNLIPFLIKKISFFTSHCGYMLCLRLYLNGDGVGANTHLSLFLVIMKGRYDAILEWPFSKKVTFRLLDQSARRQHTVTAFKPDIGSASFHRPVQAMNVASGCPEFLPLAQLHANWHSYVTNDVMFIKASILSGNILSTATWSNPSGSIAISLDPPEFYRAQPVQLFLIKQSAISL
eukprot:g35889.t1